MSQSNGNAKSSGRQGLTTVLGNVGRPFELRYTQTGKAVADTSIAVTEVWGEANDQRSRTTWFKITVWEKQAEALAKIVNQTGFSLLVSGKVGASAYTGQDGEAHATLELNSNVPGGFVQIASWPKDYQGVQDDTGGNEPEDLPF